MSWQIPVLVCGCAALTCCSPPVERSAVVVETPPPVLPASPPPPTPHPAPGARARAIQLYPDLAVKNSLMSRTFQDIVQQHSTTNPTLLSRADWPLNVAEHAARILGVASTAEATPVPKTPNALERGAYNQRRRYD